MKTWHNILTFTKNLWLATLSFNYENRWMVIQKTEKEQTCQCWANFQEVQGHFELQEKKKNI